MKKLFLDDVRKPWPGWDLVRNYSEFTKYIEKNGVPDVISFDHDLDTEHYREEMYTGDYDKLYKTFHHQTGLDCAKWLCLYCVEKGYKLPPCLVHSMNPAGGKNIATTLMTNALFYFEDVIDVPIIPYTRKDPTNERV